MREIRWLSLCVLVGACVWAGVALAAPGDPDPTFGSASLTLPGVSQWRASGAVTDSQGRIIVTGTTGPSGSEQLVLARLTPSGALDTSFNGTGVVVTTASYFTLTSDAVALTPDGHIVIAGGHGNEKGPAASVLVRFTSSGALDTTWGSGGSIDQVLGFGTAEAHAVTVAGDGTIYVAGDAGALTNSWRLVALTDAGAPRPGFGDASGRVTVPVAPGATDPSAVAALALGPSGSVYVAGSAGSGAQKLVLVRCGPSGAVISNTPAVFGAQSASARDLSIDPSGAATVVGNSRSAPAHLLAARFTPGGSLDPAFGAGGRLDLQTSSSFIPSGGALELPDGRITLAGEALTTNKPATARLLPNGTLDPAAGGDGVNVVTSGPTGEVGGVARGRPGRAVLIGDDGLHLLATGVLTADPPSAAFSGPAAAASGRQIEFDASPSTADGSIVSYEWDLDGNGSFETATGSNPRVQFTYRSPGTVHVGLRVTDSTGQQAVFRRSIAISGPPTPPPHARFSVPGSGVASGVLTLLDATGSTGQGLRYRWDFDGSRSFAIDAGTVPRVEHTFGRPGRYRIDLEVIDAGGRTDTSSQLLEVVSPFAGLKSTPDLVVKPAVPRAAHAAHLRVQGLAGLAAATEVGPASARAAGAGGSPTVPFAFGFGDQPKITSSLAGVSYAGILASSHPEVKHTFGRPGNFGTSALVAGAAGSSIEVATDVHVQPGALASLPKAPLVHLAFQDPVEAGSTVHFDASTTFPGAGSYASGVRHEWTFNHTTFRCGTRTSPADCGPRFDYTVPAGFTGTKLAVTLRVTNQQHLSDTGQFTLDIKPRRCGSFFIGGYPGFPAQTAPGSCLTEETPGHWVTHAPITVEGVQIAGGGGTLRIVATNGASGHLGFAHLFSGAGGLAGSGLILSLGGYVIGYHPSPSGIDLFYPGTTLAGELQTAAAYHGGLPAYPVRQGDVTFPPSGQVQLEPVAPALPDPFSDQSPPATPNPDGRTFHINLDEVPLGADLSLKPLILDWNPTSGNFNGSTAVVYQGQEVAAGSVVFTGGHFTSLTASRNVDAPIGDTPLVLHRIGLGLHLHPFAFNGDVNVNVLGSDLLGSLDGCVSLVSYAKADADAFNSGHGGTTPTCGSDGAPSMTYPSDFISPGTAAPDTFLRIGAHAKILSLIPVDATATFRGNGFVLTGQLSYSLSAPVVGHIYTFSVNFEGNYNGPNDWEAVASERPFPDGFVAILMSPRGVAGCFDTEAAKMGGWVSWDLQHGGGEFTGCDVTTSPVEIHPQAADMASPSAHPRALAASACATSGTIRIPKTGYADQELIIKGASTTPVVALKPPRGTAIIDNGQPHQIDRVGGSVRAEVIHWRAFFNSLPRGGSAPGAAIDPHLTIVALRHPVAGRYAITATNGACFTMQLGQLLPPPTAAGAARPLRASDPRTGQRREQVAVSMLDVPGQRVRLYDVASDRSRIPIGSVNSGRAAAAAAAPAGGPRLIRRTLSFAPAAGAGRHSVVAEVFRGRWASRSLKVTTYTVAKVRLPAPRLRTLVSRNRLTVTWRPVPYARAYQARLVVSDGRRTTLRVSAGARRLLIPVLAPGMTAKVTVTAVSAQGAFGTPGTVRVRIPPRKTRIRILVRAGLPRNPGSRSR